MCKDVESEKRGREGGREEEREEERGGRGGGEGGQLGSEIACVRDLSPSADGDGDENPILRVHI